MVFDWLLDFWTNTEWIAMLHKKKSLVVTWQFRFYMFNKYYVSIHRSIIDKIRVIYCITLWTSINILVRLSHSGRVRLFFQHCFFPVRLKITNDTRRKKREPSICLSFLPSYLFNTLFILPHYSVLFSLSYWKSMTIWCEIFIVLSQRVWDTYAHWWKTIRVSYVPIRFSASKQRVFSFGEICLASIRSSFDYFLDWKKIDHYSSL